MLLSKLVLGNNTASGTESNAKGEITIYGTNTGSTVITAGNNSTSTVALTLPAESGTLALKSDIPDNTTTEVDLSDRMKFTKYTNDTDSIVKIYVSVTGALYKEKAIGYIREPLKICGIYCGTSSSAATYSGIDMVYSVSYQGNWVLKSLGDNAIATFSDCNWKSVPDTAGVSNGTFEFFSWVGAHGELWVEHSESYEVSISTDKII